MNGIQNTSNGISKSKVQACASRQAALADVSTDPGHCKMMMIMIIRHFFKSPFDC